MRISNVSITSSTALDFEVNSKSPITLLCGGNATLALDLIREVTGEDDLKTDPDSVDDGRFIIHADVEIDNKNYSVCYIRNADFIGDNRIAANFKPNSIEFSEDDTMEFLEKRKDVSKESRPIFIYPWDLEGVDVSALIQNLASDDKQAFIGISKSPSEIDFPGVTNVFVN